MPTITFSGLVSGLDTSSWVDALVSVKQLTVTSLQAKMETVQAKQTDLSTLQTAFTTLRSSVEKLTDAKYGGSLDLFAGNQATSSDDSIFTATATSSAIRQSCDIKVEQLAGKTMAQSDKPVAAYADDTTKLSTLGLKDGTFSVYVNGKKGAVEVDEDETLGDLKEKLSQYGVTAEIDNDGFLSLSATNSSDKLLVGATNDDSNFKSVFGLESQNDGSYKSTMALFKVNTSSKLTDEGLFTTGQVDEDGEQITTSITAGTFTIGDATFTIDSNTTIASLINNINANEDAGVNAYWDSANSKLQLTSKIEGSSYINIEAGTSNFTDVMGFTETTRNEDNSISESKLLTDNQDVGDNAIVYINGAKIVSSSNTVTSDISHLSGVTLNLKGVNTEEKATSTLTVEQDTSKIEDALNTFIDNYNSLMDKLDELTDTGASFYSDSSISQIQRSLRQLITSSFGDSNDKYNLLAQVGISTASAGADLNDDTSSLSLDTDKLKEALSESSEGVKKLLVGSGSNANGILSQMNTILSNTLSTSGYLSTLSSTLSSEVDKYEDKISTANTRIESYRSNLESKFQAMEQTISDMQSAYSDYISSD